MKSVDFAVLVFVPGERERERESESESESEKQPSPVVSQALSLPSGEEGSPICFDRSEDNFTALPPNPRSELSR